MLFASSVILLFAVLVEGEMNRGSTFSVRPGWYMPGNGFQYKLTTSRMNFERASIECQGWGGTLAQHGMRDRFFFRKISEHFSSPVWIGLDSRNSSGRFYWADERPMQAGWMQDCFFREQNDVIREDCVIMTNQPCLFQPKQMLDDVACVSSHFGLCEMNVGGSPQYHFTAYDGSMFTLITEETTYKFAKSLCQKWGGRLAELPVIDSRLAQSLVEALYGNMDSVVNGSSSKSLNSWVGLNDIDEEGNLVMESGSDVNSSHINWATDFNREDRDCATFNPRYRGKIQLERCSKMKTTLCEKREVGQALVQSQPNECLPEIAECAQSGYRTIDGSCHNMLNPDRGREKRPFKRMLPSAYEDGRGIPRGGFPSRLPSPRAIIHGLKEETEPPSLVASHQFPLWGQLMAHDLTKLGELKAENGVLLLSCPCGDNHPECFNIPIPEGDPTGGKCYSFVRAERVPDINCDTSVREQENRVTSFIDASNVYGSNEQFFENLRTDGGMLRMGNYTSSKSHGLPAGNQVPNAMYTQFECEAIHFDTTSLPCFAGGDIRVNEQAALASGHTLWIRKHNQIAAELKLLNPHWNSDKIFYTARSVIAAIHQQITFNEFLPVLVGEKHMERFGLKLTKQGYYYGYDSNYDSTIDISFATAALRLGHTLINGFLSRPYANFSENPHSPKIDLRSQFFDAIPILEENGVGAVLRGMVADHAMKYDTQFAKALTDHLFAKRGEFGRDLPSINIQRGRDHGIPSYMEHRRFCGLSTSATFEGMDDILPSIRSKLRDLYKNGSTEDIDLFVGGISEVPQDASSGIPGPTFSCIISYQARDLRKGDRYWFENGGAETKFTYDQLQAIKAITLARIICDAGGNIESIQPKAMMMHTVAGNERVNCSNITALDLSPFQESRREFPNSNPIKANHQDFEWTVWFPYSITSATSIPLKPAPSLLRHLRVYRNDDVCDDVMGTEVKPVNGYYQIRYKCPVGSIKATDFPPVDSKEVYWTLWSDQDTPTETDYDDNENLAGSGACLYPVAIQAQTIDHIPARETGDVFEMFSPFQGLLCKGIHQESRRCNDYRIRFLCLRD